MDSSPLSVAIVRALADVEGVEPMDLDYALADFINPDVIDRLAEDDRGEWEFDFVVDEHLVTIDSDGHLIVDGHSYRNSTP